MEAVNNARQVKLALDAFAADHNGLYPNEKLHEKYGTSGSSSNALLRQLFAAEVTESEKIFWVVDSSVAGKKPPKGRVPSTPLALGVNHWAYAHGLSQNSEGSAPVIFDPWETGTRRFHHKTWDKKAIVAQVDGSVRAMKLRLSDRTVLDSKDQDLFGASSDVWQDNPPDIRQPEAR